MADTLIPESELMEWTGHKRRTALINWLREQGIPYMLGAAGRVCCTTDAINLPLLRNQINNSSSTDDIEF